MLTQEFDRFSRYALIYNFDNGEMLTLQYTNYLELIELVMREYEGRASIYRIYNYVPTIPEIKQAERYFRNFIHKL